MQIFSPRILLPLLLLLFAAALPRFWELERYPYFFGWEHDWLGTEAVEILEGKRSWSMYNLFTFHNGEYLRTLRGITFPADLVAISFWLFGPSIWAMKLVAALVGILFVLVLWRVGARHYSERFGFVAALLAACSPFAMGLSRDLHIVVPIVALLALLTLDAFLCARKNPSFMRLWWLFGLSFFSLHLYSAAYAIFAFVGLGVSWTLVTDADWRRRAFAPLCWALLAAAPLLAPILYYIVVPPFSQEPGVLLVHVLGNSSNLSGEALSRNLWGTLRHVLNLGNTLNFTSGVKDYNQSTGAVYPLHYALLFLVGLGAALARLRQDPRVMPLLIFVAVTLLAGILSAPMARRLVSFEPLMYIFAALGVEALLACSLGRVFSRPALRLASGSLLGLLLWVLGFSEYARLVQAAPSDPTREMEEYLAPKIKQGEVAILAFPIPGVKGALQMLCSDAYALHESPDRFFSRPTLKGFLTVQPPPDAERLQLALRLGGDSQLRCTREQIERALATNPQTQSWSRWDVAQRNSSTPLEYLVYGMPRRDLGIAQELLARCWQG